MKFLDLLYFSLARQNPYSNYFARSMQSLLIGEICHVTIGVLTNDSNIRDHALFYIVS